MVISSPVTDIPRCEQFACPARKGRFVDTDRNRHGGLLDGDRLEGAWVGRVDKSITDVEVVDA
eukprot:scaffold208132_cov29-Tisochrysis_lutea.AAC.4